MTESQGSQKEQHTFQGATAGQLMESILSLVDPTIRAAARAYFQTAIQLAILDEQTQSESGVGLTPRWRAKDPDSGDDLIELWKKRPRHSDEYAAAEIIEQLERELAEARRDRDLHRQAAHEADLRTQAAVRSEKSALSTRSVSSESGQGTAAQQVPPSERTRSAGEGEVSLTSAGEPLSPSRPVATPADAAALTQSASGAIAKMNEAIGRGLNHVFFEDGLSADLHEMSNAEAYREGWRDAWLEMADDLAAIDSRSKGNG